MATASEVMNLLKVTGAGFQGLSQLGAGLGQIGAQRKQAKEKLELREGLMDLLAPKISKKEEEIAGGFAEALKQKDPARKKGQLSAIDLTRARYGITEDPESLAQKSKTRKQIEGMPSEVLKLLVPKQPSVIKHLGGRKGSKEDKIKAIKLLGTLTDYKSNILFAMSQDPNTNKPEVMRIYTDALRDVNRLKFETRKKIAIPAGLDISGKKKKKKKKKDK